MIDLNVRALVELTHLYWPKILRKKRGGVLDLARPPDSNLARIWRSTAPPKLL